jgi:hypothetical protein
MKSMETLFQAIVLRATEVQLQRKKNLNRLLNSGLLLAGK